MSELVRAGALVGRPVIVSEDAAELGSVSDVVYDPDRLQVLGLRTGGGFLGLGQHDLIRWNRISSVGDDAIMIASADAAQSEGETPAAAPVGENIVGVDVLTESGDRVGAVRDMVIAIGDGSVVAYEVELDADRGEGSAYLPTSEQVAISGDAAVIRDHDRLLADLAALERRYAKTPTGDQTKAELYERARAAEIRGRSKMTKDELAAALSEAERSAR